MLLFYNFFIRIYHFAIWLVSIWNKKAAEWINGRKDLFQELEKSVSPADHIIWMHCSSAGEFEQGIPVIEALKKRYPDKKIVVSFFSPSGYGVAKKGSVADVITYLPLDTKKNAERFFNILKPQLVIFVKYEFWYHHLMVTAFHQVPILLISATFRKDQIFFKPYGRFFRQMLQLFRHIFVQDAASLQLLQANGITQSSIGGDTRFDRVQTIAQNFSDIPFIQSFIEDKKLIVAGSTWPGDEEVLAAYLEESKILKCIIVPHEINASHIASIQTVFKNAVLYSSLQENEKTIQSLPSAQTLIIDSVGLLSRLYKYATIAYVGGGFTKDGIHNILEATVWGKPVVIGPNYKKYREAKEMIAAGGAFSIQTTDELKKLADDLLNHSNHLQAASEKARKYSTDNTGATQIILATIQEKRLLTNW